MPNPERILEKLEEYYKLKEKIDEITEAQTEIYREVRYALRDVLEDRVREENVVKFLIVEVWAIFCKYSDLNAERLKEKLLSTLEEYEDEGLEFVYEITKPTIRQYITDDLCEAMLKVYEKYKPRIEEYRRLGRDKEKIIRYRREIFGIESGDIISLDNLVRLVYKCVKYALEE